MTKTFPDPIHIKTLKEARKEFEIEYIKLFLSYHNGCVAETARDLGIARQHLHLKIKKLKINSKEFRK